MTDSSEKLIKSEIKARKVTYYLTSEEDLGSVRSNSLLGDIFSVLASLAGGGIISVALTRATGIQLGQETANVLGILVYVFVILTIIFAGFAAYFHYRSFAVIKKIKGSGTVKSVKSGDQEEELVEMVADTKETASTAPKLEILKAEYWTPKARLDVTQELRNKIVDNRLIEFANNAIKRDPDEGTVKKLTIEYKFDGITVTKEFTEGEKMVIP
jgi:hypothetical protein